MVALILGLAGCGGFAYYSQSLNGHLELLAEREPISTLVDNPDLPQDLKQKLALALDVRLFASSDLGLPDNGSYKSYADLNRQYVVWNVFAAPEFSLEPLTWCYLIVGCLSYRGYFSEDDARRYTEELRKQGYDIFVGGVAAYSTLGWFDDPVLNTMLQWSDTRLAKVIFHELTHQKVYIPDDTAFNEAFADTVAREGVCRWLAIQGTAEAHYQFRLEEDREAQFVQLVLEFRDKLESMYAAQLPADQMRTKKKAILESMQNNYEALKQHWAGYETYDSWFASGLNNAKIAAIATYREYMPAFQAMLEETNGNLELFYQRAAALGDLPKDERQAELNRKLAGASLGVTANTPQPTASARANCFSCTVGSCLEVSTPPTYG